MSDQTRRAGLSLGAILDVDAVLDCDDRPLGEHRAPPHLTGAAPTERKTCPYDGTRHRHPQPMNVSALRQTVWHFEEALASLSFLRAQIRQEPGPSTLPEAWKTAVAASVLPSYLLHRALPTRGRARISGPTATLYKASLGVKYLVEQRALVATLDGHALRTPLDASDLSTFADTGGHLIGAAEVCAAPEQMIRRTLGALTRGTVLDATSAVEREVGDIEPFLAFTGAAWDLYATLLVFATLGARTRAAIGESAERDPMGLPIPLTLGMGQTTSKLGRLGRDRCLHALRELCGMAECPAARAIPKGLPSVLDLLSDHVTELPEPAGGERGRAQVYAENGGASHRGPSVEGWMKSYRCLEETVQARVAQLQLRMNDALGRGDASGLAPLDLSKYCSLACPRPL